MKPAAIVSIEPLGSQVYTVTMSANHPACLPDSFTVSLRDYEWNGSCTCPTFTGCCSILLQKTKKRWRCDHIVACRMWFMEKEASKLLESNEPKIVVMPDYPYDEDVPNQRR